MQKKKKKERKKAETTNKDERYKGKRKNIMSQVLTARASVSYYQKSFYGNCFTQLVNRNTIPQELYNQG